MILCFMSIYDPHCCLDLTPDTVILKSRHLVKQVNNRTVDIDASVLQLVT